MAIKKELCFADRVRKKTFDKWLFIISSGIIHAVGLLMCLSVFKLLWLGLPIKLVLVVSCLGGIVYAHTLYSIIGRTK
jgi:hypothetical protein